MSSARHWPNTIGQSVRTGKKPAGPSNSRKKQDVSVEGDSLGKIFLQIFLYLHQALTEREIREGTAANSSRV